jgi:hypothetical protein
LCPAYPACLEDADVDFDQGCAYQPVGGIVRVSVTTEHSIHVYGAVPSPMQLGGATDQTQPAGRAMENRFPAQ